MRWLIVLAVLIGSLAVQGFANAGGTPCVSYSVTAPIVGTHSGQKCPVPMPDPIDFPIRARNCGGIDPAGVSWCLEARIYIVNG